METKTYSGACHCGKVRYKVTSDLSMVIDCNCSICSKKGSVLTFVGPEQFELLSGQDAVTDYQFNAHNIHHLFCATCGIGAFGRGTGRDGKPMISINLRCVEDMDISQLAIHRFDGKSL